MVVLSRILFRLLCNQSLSYREDFGLVSLSVTMYGKEYSEQVENRWWRLVVRISMLWIFVFDRTDVENSIPFQFKTKRLFELKNLRNTSHNNIKEPNITYKYGSYCKYI